MTSVLRVHPNALPAKQGRGKDATRCKPWNGMQPWAPPMDRCCASMRPWSGAGHDTTLSVGRPECV